MDLLGLGFDIIIFLIVGSAFAGFVDAISGGGGLISVPVLLMAGFSPAQAVSANKLQGAVGAIASVHYYSSKGVLEKDKLIVLLPPALIGGALGTFLLHWLGNEVMSKVIPVMLILSAVYFFFSKSIREEDVLPKIPISIFAATIIPLIALYDGFFGPGAGTFYLLGLVSLLGMNAVKGMAYSRTLNLASNLISLIIFIYLGKMAWLAGIMMAIGETIGVYLGSHFVYKKGAKLVKPLIVIVCILMSIKLIYGNI